MTGQSSHRIPRVRRRWRLGSGYRIAVFLLWPVMTAFTKRDWQGMQRLNTDDGGIIVVANHISWFDPLVISHAMWENDRPPRFLAKESVFRVPVIGSIIESAGQIRVYRETKEAVAAVRDAIAAVQRGECVVVYPEGTITKDPNEWPMAGKTGAARIALATGRPVLPMAQWGATQVMRPYRKELRLLPRKTMHVWVGEPVDLSDFADRPMDHDTLEQATERIMDALSAELGKIRQLAPPEHRFTPEHRNDGTQHATHGGP
jgi:1-acyl-sn-glycerol-3-phosphate acyltransferase